VSIYLQASVNYDFKQQLITVSIKSGCG